MSDKIEIIIAPFSNDSIGKRLHPDYKFSFRSLLGEMYNLGSGMRYINSNEFKLSSLGKKIDTKEFNKIKAGGTKYVANYWEFVKLLTLDRILADKELVFDLVNELGSDVSKVKFTILYKLTQGIATEEVLNTKLFTYGVILESLVNKIVTRFLGFLDSHPKVSSIEYISTYDYKFIKDKIKQEVFDIAVSRSDGSIATDIADIDNETLRKAYMGKKIK